MNQILLETKMFRLSDGEEIMTLAFFILIQYRSVTDGQTDRRADRRTDMPPLAIPAVCIARYANALVKIVLICQRGLGLHFALSSEWQTAGSPAVLLFCCCTAFSID